MSDTSQSKPPEFDGFKIGDSTGGAEPVPPEGCICASFFTVRQAHKKDCPLWVEPVSEVGDILENYASDCYVLWNGEPAPERKHKLLDDSSAAIQRLIAEARVDEVKRRYANLILDKPDEFKWKEYADNRIAEFNQMKGQTE